jgi:hypothetical protein
MKSTLRLFIASALLAPAAVFAASFEGKVSFKMTAGKGQPQEMHQSIKGDKVRMEFSSQRGTGGMILDGTKKEMIMMMDDQKMYMTMAIPDVAAEAVDKKREDTVKFEKTGETEKILGYTATKYIATNKDGTKTDVWLAEGLGTFMGMGNNNNPMGGKRGGPAASADWERLIAGKELFPLRVIGYDKAAKETFRMEATAVSKEKLPDTLFVPPANYQKLDMGGMMKGIVPGFGK